VGNTTKPETIRRWRVLWEALWVLGVLLAACGQSPSPTTTAPTPQPSAATPTAVAPGGSFTWSVSIVQNGQTLPEENGQVTLARAPFTIQVRMPQPLTVQLNVLDTDQNFRDIQPGHALTADCLSALCPGTGIVEDNFGASRSLVIDPQGTHYLYYAGPNEHRWNKVEFTADGVVFEREVAFLNGVPVEQFSGPALYLLFYVEFHNSETIDEDELKKVTLKFP
jgi:hypothetical protein